MNRNYEYKKEAVENAEKLNLEIINLFYNEQGKRCYTLKCKIHYWKKEWTVPEINLIKQKTCGCKIRNYDILDLEMDLIDRKDIKILGEYINNSTKMDFQCEEGHIFQATPNKILQRRGCPICKPQKLRKRFLSTKEEFQVKLEAYNPSLEIISDYQGARFPCDCKCKICGEITHAEMANKFLNEKGCFYCNLSIGEQIIWGELKKNNIEFIPQKRFDDCKDKNLLPFDFYLPKYNTCIEFQREQHYFPLDLSYTPTEKSKEMAIEKFLSGQKRDKIKEEYCKTNNIFLLKISYKDKKRIGEILKEFFNQFNQKL